MLENGLLNISIARCSLAFDGNQTKKLKPWCSENRKWPGWKKNERGNWGRRCRSKERRANGNETKKGRNNRRTRILRWRARSSNMRRSQIIMANCRDRQDKVQFQKHNDGVNDVILNILQTRPLIYFSSALCCILQSYDERYLLRNSKQQLFFSSACYWWLFLHGKLTTTMLRIMTKLAICSMGTFSVLECITHIPFLTVQHNPSLILSSR